MWIGSRGAVSLLTEARVWPGDGRPRRAGVSSFGISGTNAHVILEQAPPEPAVVEAWLVAGFPVGWGCRWCRGWFRRKTEQALAAQAGRLLAHVQQHPQLDVGDVGYSLAGRSVFEYRAVVVGADRQELCGGVGGVGCRPTRWGCGGGSGVFGG